MKKLFLSIAFLLLAQITIAQDTSFKADVLKLISINGDNAQINLVKSKFLNMIPENKKENFSKDFDASIPNLNDKMANIYMEIYTADDIKAMIAFYESPAGKKIKEKAAELGQKSMQAGQEWSKELLELITKYKKDTPTQSTYTVTKSK